MGGDVAGGRVGAEDGEEAVRFHFVEASYGCHGGRFDFPETAGPVVILGPNGAGKTTLVEALLRTLYGFNRQRREDRAILEERRPWKTEAFAATVGLSGRFGRLVVSRDFETAEVVVRREGEGRPLYRGDANPAASGEEARRYRRLLEEWLGLEELDGYERTACIRQGGLLETRLGEDLLRLASGGHGDVESARERIREEYYELTREPVAPEDAPRRKDGRIEKLGERLADLEARLDEALEAEARREPLVRERDELKDRSAELREEVALLEKAGDGLSELETLQARLEAARERLDRLEEAERELDEAVARLDLLEDRDPPDARTPAYPEDFLERAAALEEGLWPRERELEAEEHRLREERDRGTGRGRWPAALAALGGMASAGGGVWIAAAGPALLPGALLVTGLLLGAAGAWRFRARRLRRERAVRRLERVEEERERVRARIRELLQGVPRAETLEPRTLLDRRRAFLAAREETRMREAARAELRSQMDRSRGVLDREVEAGEAGAEPITGAGSVRRDETLLSRARERLRRLRDAASRERDEVLAPLRLEVREASREQLALPDGVPAESAAVRAAVRARREELSDLGERLAEAERRLAYEGRPEASSVALRRRLAELRTDRERAQRKAASYRHAFRLVADAWDAFRERDQDRLLEAVSRHLAGITGGGLGPIVVREEGGDGEGLEAARVRSGERTLSLASPPLSYGQLHAALFAVRLGAADFLAGLGVRLPLVVDDPFVHLDEHRAAELWVVLEEIAVRRQVLVATQDRLLLDHLGVRPHLRLDADGSGGGPPTEADGSAGGRRDEGGGGEEEDGEPGEGVPADTGRPGDVTLDLWGSL